MPGVVSYYGYDKASDTLVHVHAHFQLVLGHDATKNYRLPIERPFLDSAVQDELFKVPAPEFELIVFVIRMVLKHSTWVPCGRQGSLSLQARGVRTPASRSSQTQVCTTSCTAPAYVEATLFGDCRGTEARLFILGRARAGQMLQGWLRTLADQITDVCLKLWRRAVGQIGRRVHNVFKERLADGGAMVAVVGGDGAGKSTLRQSYVRGFRKTLTRSRCTLGSLPGPGRPLL
jgi:hypothetical protein